MNPLKLIIPVLLALLPCAASAVNYLDVKTGMITEKSNGGSVKVMATPTPTGYKVTYTIDYAAISEAIPESGGNILSLDGFSLTTDPTRPALPWKNDSFVIPEGYTATLSLGDCDYRELPMKLCAPSNYIGKSYSAQILQQNEIKPYNGLHPQLPVVKAKSQIYRKQHVVNIEVTPILYDYNNELIRVYSTLTYNVDFTPSATSRKSGKKQQSDNVDFPKVEVDALTPGLRWPPKLDSVEFSKYAIQSDAGYLILTLPSLESEAERFAQWKRLMGYNVTVVARTGWTPELIKSTVQQHYENDPLLMHLLLIGNHKDLPAMTIKNKFKECDNNIADSLLITDYYYGCMDGDDDTMADIYRGRWATSDGQEVEAIVDKLIWSQKQPTTDSLFYRKAVHSAVFQYYPNGLDGISKYNPRYNGCEKARFIHTSEDVRDYIQSNENAKKEIDRVYWEDIHTRLNPSWIPTVWNFGEFGPFDFIPEETVSEILKNKDFTALEESIEDGRLYVLYRGHGVQNGLMSSNHQNGTTYGKDFDINRALNLRNAEWQPLFLSICCQTGNFSDKCLAHGLLVNESGGANCVIAATNDGPMGYDDVFTIGIFNAIWPKPGFSPNMPSLWPRIDFTNDQPAYQFGQILDKSLNVTESNYQDLKGLGLYTKEIFHCFGDPSMMFTTEVPSEFIGADIQRNDKDITVDLDNQVAYIAFLDHTTGQIHRYFGNYIKYENPHPENVSVGISAHNKIPLISPGDDYTDSGMPESHRVCRIKKCTDLDGAVQIDYITPADAVNPNIVVVDLQNNWIRADVKCSPGEHSIGVHVPAGIYAVTLFTQNYPMHNVRMIVSHEGR